MSTPAASGSTTGPSQTEQRKTGQARTPEKRSVSVNGKTHLTDDYQSLVDQLRKEQNEMKNERKRLAREMRNAHRRTQRIRHKARELSTQDLLQVLMLRRQTAEKREAREALEADSAGKKPRANDPEPPNADHCDEGAALLRLTPDHLPPIRLLNSFFFPESSAPPYPFQLSLPRRQHHRVAEGRRELEYRVTTSFFTGVRSPLPSQGR